MDPLGSGDFCVHLTRKKEIKFVAGGKLKGVSSELPTQLVCWATAWDLNFGCAMAVGEPAARGMLGKVRRTCPCWSYMGMTVRLVGACENGSGVSVSHRMTGWIDRWGVGSEHLRRRSCGISLFACRPVHRRSLSVNPSRPLRLWRARACAGEMRTWFG